MKNESTFFQLIPEIILKRIEEISDLLRPNIKGFSIDNLKEVISVIACHTQYKKDEDKSPAAPLNMAFLKKLVPQADNYMKGLIKFGVVQRSGKYNPGETSFKYQFSPEYQSKYTRIILTNAALKRRIKTAHAKTKKTTRTKLGRSDQNHFIKQLTIEPRCIDFINANYSKETNQYNDIMQSATRIINGDIFYKVDDTSGRYHSNITNMAKGLRTFLRINGEPLVNIDIKNSQPYLLTVILTNPAKVASMAKKPAFAMMLQSLKVPKKEDVMNFINLVVSGEFYEYFMQELSKTGLHLTRSETKQQVLKILYDKNRLPADELGRVCKITFKKIFPTVNKVFNKIRGRNHGDRFTSYKRFAILLQTIESYLLLEVILKRIYKELPGVIAVTIHDSIMTGAVTNQVDAIRKIMTNELTKFVGFVPKIKIEEVDEVKGDNKGRNIKSNLSNQYDAINTVCYTNSIK